MKLFQFISVSVFFQHFEDILKIPRYTDNRDIFCHYYRGLKFSYRYIPSHRLFSPWHTQTLILPWTHHLAVKPTWAMLLSISNILPHYSIIHLSKDAGSLVLGSWNRQTTASPAGGNLWAGTKNNESCAVWVCLGDCTWVSTLAKNTPEWCLAQLPYSECRMGLTTSDIGKTWPPATSFPMMKWTLSMGNKHVTLLGRNRLLIHS